MRRRGGVCGALGALFALAPTAAAPDPALAACPAAPPGRHAPAPERVVRIATPDGRIAGTLAGPADAAPRARVLMLHGYTGARNEIPTPAGEGMFARAARAFAERGIASLRIDFLGSGESDGAWADTSFETQTRDARRARAFLAAKTGAPDATVAALGYSQGGLVALRAAARDPGFARLALWNPVLDPVATYGLIFGPQTLAEGAARAAAGDGAAMIGDTGLRAAFFAGIAAADPVADGGGTDAPTLLIAGRRDTLVRDGPARAARLAASRAAETRVIAPDAGHDLGATTDLALFDAVVACTAGFLAAPR